jgi:DNA primase
VEDQMSAIKLAPHVHSLALLGTHISDEKAEEIVAGKYKQVLISLDNDATHEAIKLQLIFRNKIKNLYLAGLGKDIKDMTQGELNEYLSQNVQ